MFSIIHGLFSLFAIGVDNWSKTSTNITNKQRAIQNGSKTYYGARGNEYLVDNDRWVYTKINDQGEEVIVDMKNGRLYYNLTQEKKRKEEEKCKQQGKTVRPHMEDECRKHYYGKYKQPFHLIDIDSGIPVNDITINGIKFYIRLDNGKVLRLVDNCNMENKVGCWNTEEIINLINDRQNKLRTELEKHDYYWIRWNFFFHSRYVYIDNKKEIHVFDISPNESQWKFIREDMKGVM